MRPVYALIFILLLGSPAIGKKDPPLKAPIPLAKPGNIQASFTRDSISHILGFIVPIAGYYLWGGGIEGAIPLGIEASGSFWSVEVRSLKFIPLDPFTTAEMNWVEDAELPTTELKIVNITTDIYLDVHVNLFGFPMWGSNIHTKDLNISLEIAHDQVYDVYPQFHITPKLEAKELKFGFFIFGWLIRAFIG